MPACASRGTELLDRPLDVGLAGLAARVEERGEIAEGLGLEELEREVFELPLDLPDAEALRQRCVDLDASGGRSAAASRRRSSSVRMLWSRSASLMRTTRTSSAIARNIFRMFSACCCSWCGGGELGQLGHAVDEACDFRAEALLDLGEAVVGVLGDVVEERRLDGDRVEAEVGEDLGRGDRMRDERLARCPVLWLWASTARSNACSTTARSAFG